MFLGMLLHYKEAIIVVEVDKLLEYEERRKRRRLLVERKLEDEV